MATIVDDLVNNITTYRFNPAAIQRAQLKLIPSITNGELDVVDPTNPFVYALECIACNTSAFMQEMEAEERRRYPLLSVTQEDLYLHMSEKDYIGRFATPAEALFTLRFPKEGLLAAMEVEASTGYLKATIPRNTYFTIAGMQFALQYPIDIRQAAHGGLQVTYDTEIVSPLQTLESNSIIPTEESTSNGTYVRIDVPTMQFSIKQQLLSISKSSTNILTMSFDDQFYFARVYYESNGSWVEMTTTHSEIVYDVTDPTAVLRVDESSLTVTIPQIYVSNNVLTSKIRVDLYQTKGAINVQMANYPMNSFGVTWKSYDSFDAGSVYSAKLSNLSVPITSDASVIDGANGITLAELRDQVITNTTGPVDVSITPQQMKTKLSNKGYDVVLHIDRVTDRVFLATRAMPAPTIVTPTTASTATTQLLTPAAASIETLSITLDALALLPTVIDNGTSVTITPDTIYQIIDGITQVVAQTEIDRLLALAADKRALEVTNGTYMYTPYHYVLDSTNSAFEVRPYYLDAPVAQSKLFVDQNDTTLMQVNTEVYGITRTTTGYLLQIVTSSDDAYKAIEDSQVYAQLAYIPYGERDRAYANGTFVGKTTAGERIFNFDLSTNFNVDANNNLELTRFTMYNTDSRITKSPLFNTFDILHATSQTMTAYWVAGDIDAVLGKYLLPQQIAGINWEQVRIKFGDNLNMLWTRARTVTSSIVYQSWQADVLAYYTEDIYLRDENGSAISVVDGQIVSTILHHAGDPMVDANGDQIYLHRKGDILLGPDGAPLPANPRGLVRQMDLMLLEGAYWFATDATTTSYRTMLTSTVAKWLVEDLASFTGTLLDQTRIYFYPKTTSGVVSVYVGENIQKTIQAGQSFTVTLSVTEQVYKNDTLRKRLTQVTTTTLSTALAVKTVAYKDLLKALSNAYSDDVIGIEMSGLGGTANYPVMSLVSDADRLSIKKRLTALGDNTLVVEEDVTVLFAQHNPDGPTNEV